MRCSSPSRLGSSASPRGPGPGMLGRLCLGVWCRGRPALWAWVSRHIPPCVVPEPCLSCPPAASLPPPPLPLCGLSVCLKPRLHEPRQLRAFPRGCLVAVADVADLPESWSFFRVPRMFLFCVRFPHGGPRLGRFSRPHTRMPRGSPLSLKQDEGLSVRSRSRV